MREIFDFAVEEIRPRERNVLGALGLGPGQEPSEKVSDLVVQATELFVDLVEPKGMFETITLEEFENIYPGDGLNASRTPLEGIFPEADRMALFVLTLGKSVSQEIEDLFARNDFALAYTLDAIASAGAECAADRLEERFDALVLGDVASYYSTARLRYSPGYCGWHISGQKKLFERLRARCYRRRAQQELLDAATKVSLRSYRLRKEGDTFFQQQLQLLRRVHDTNVPGPPEAHHDDPKGEQLNGAFAVHRQKPRSR